jgi:fatty-acyl-CoA synthase
LPKAAIITHVKWLATGRRWLAMTDLHGDDVFYCVLPLHHGAALMSLLSAVLAAGACCVLRRKFSASNFWKEVATHRVTVFCYVGEICRYLVGTTPVPEENGHSLRIMLGAGMGVDVWRQFTARFGEHIRIYEGLGATESNCGLTNLENVPGCCGRIPYWDRTHMRLGKYDVERDCHVRGVDGFAVGKLPHYAVPLFVRIVKVMDLTSSFKLRKLGLQEEGYDPVRCGGQLYVLDQGSKAYSQYSAARLAALGVAPSGRASTSTL